ncbi:MAG: hypothetical protein U9P00_08250, partial [Pseudomonadota bacterium]|nr:hypothetical protein [Pseudomonadota bacterium]
METTGPTSGISQSLATTTQSLTAQWQVGQLLRATVTESRSGKVLLAIGNRQVSAETSLALEKGQQLTLQVRSLRGQPVLKITASPSQSPINSAIRLLLPKQGSMPPLLATMGQLARSSNPPVSPAINELVRSVVKQMPDIETAASPQGLKKAISESGVFLERQLLQQPHRPPGTLIINSDFKANLLRLVQLVRHWPGSGGQTTATAPHAQTAASAAGAPSAAERATAAQTTPPASPDQIKRAVQASVGGKPASPAAPPAASSATMAATPGTAVDSGSRGTSPSSLPAGTLPPPLRGSLP